MRTGKLVHQMVFGVAIREEVFGADYGNWNVRPRYTIFFGDLVMIVYQHG
jgi:hypothetical protein